MKFECKVCGEQRSPDDITTAHHPLADLEFPANRRNVNHCADKPNCRIIGSSPTLLKRWNEDREKHRKLEADNH